MSSLFFLNILLDQNLLAEAAETKSRGVVSSFAKRIGVTLGPERNARFRRGDASPDLSAWVFTYESPGNALSSKSPRTFVFEINAKSYEVSRFINAAFLHEVRDRTDLVKPEELERADLARRIAECQRKASRMVLPRLGLWPTKPVTMRGGEAFDYPIPSIVVPYRFQFKGVPLIDVMDGARFTFALENGELYDYTMTRRAKVTLATAKIEKDEARETAIAHYRKGREKNPTREYAAPVSRPTGRLAYVVPAALFGYEPNFLPWEPEAQLGYAFRFGEVHLYVSAVTGKVIGGRAADLDLR